MTSTCSNNEKCVLSTQVLVQKVGWNCVIRCVRYVTRRTNYTSYLSVKPNPVTKSPGDGVWKTWLISPMAVVFDRSYENEQSGAYVNPKVLKERQSFRSDKSQET